jgi:hypothetical protein
MSLGVVGIGRDGEARESLGPHVHVGTFCLVRLVLRQIGE